MATGDCFTGYVVLRTLFDSGEDAAVPLSDRSTVGPRDESVEFTRVRLASIPRLGLRETLYSEGANWHGHVVTFIDHGTTTFFGWLVYVERIVTFGLPGVLGAIVFWVVWSD